MDDTDWEKVERENILELYIKLFPYILRDFAHINDVQAFLQDNFVQQSTVLFLDKISNTDGIRQALEYKELLDSGEDLETRVKPIIEL